MKYNLIAGILLKPNSKVRRYITIPNTNFSIPITIICGATHGPSILVTAGIHGGEYPGIAAAMELGRDLEPPDIQGTLILIHPVNIQSFWARTAEIVPEDGKNINRCFPGNSQGSISDKIAHFLHEELQLKADFYLDLHSGDIHEDLHPYVYYPGGTTSPTVTARAREVAQVLNVEYMVQSTATTGAYNYAALHGIPSLLIERGGNGFCRREDIDAYKDDILHALAKLNHLSKPINHTHTHIYTPQDIDQVIYLTIDKQACWFHHRHSGEKIKKGDILGYTTDLFGNIEEKYYAQISGVVLYITPALAVNSGNVLIAYGSIKE